MAKNLTSGNPAKLIVMFTLPLLLGNLFQQFYNMADAFIVGRILGVNALAAVGCTGAIMFLILGFAFGMASGFAIVTAQRFGAGDFAGVRRSYTVSLFLAGVGTVVLTVVSVVLARPFLVMMNTPADILEDAYTYTVIIMWGIGATMLFNLVSSMMRAVGDSRSPLVFLVIACLLNIALDYAFILGLGMGVEGAAYATIAAQGISGILCLIYAHFKLPVLQVTKRDWRFTKDDLIQHAKLGLPMGFQSSIIAIGALVMQFALNGLGTKYVAGVTAAQKIDAFATMPLMSFGVTMATYTAQNYGAAKYDRILKGVRQCCLISVSFAIIMGIVNIIFGQTLAGFFVGGDAEIAGYAHTYLIIIGINYFLLALLFIFRYTLQGLGKSFIPTIAGIMELVMRSFAAITFTRMFGFKGACSADPMAWLGACIPLTIAYVLTAKRVKNLSFTQDADTAPLAEKTECGDALCTEQIE